MQSLLVLRGCRDSSLAAPSEDFERTTTTGVCLLEWARAAAPQASLVFASSAAVYGTGHTAPIAENATRSPCSPYGVHKAMLEMAAESWARSFGVRVAIVRLFSVYGPQLCKQLIYDKAKFSPVRSDCCLAAQAAKRATGFYIGDAAKILIEAIAHGHSSAPVFNGCSGKAATIRETITRLAASAKVDLEIDFLGTVRVGDPAHSVVIQRAPH